MTRWRRVGELGVLVLAFLLLFWFVGVANPIPRPGVNTDRLGPDNGETVDEYIARSWESVDLASADDDLHWSLVSFTAETSPVGAFEAAGGVRIAQVLVRVPLERVQTQVIAVGVPGTERSVTEAGDVAASRLQGSMGQWDRQAQIDGVSASRLAAGCDCVVGLVVHAPATALDSILSRPDVRAVESLPSDARAGKFAVRALLPDYVDVVGPLPDDGPIPPA